MREGKSFVIWGILKHTELYSKTDFSVFENY